MTIVGVDQGIAQVLDAEPVIARARVRLIEAGLGSGVGTGLWVCTHVVATSPGTNHAAYTVVVPDGVDPDALLEAVASAFAPGSQGPDEPHVHDEPDAPSLWLDGRVVGDPARAEGARLAAEAQAGTGPSRAVVYPGSDAMTGTVRLGDVTLLTAIDDVRAMGGALEPDAQLVTRDHVRPLRQGGQWVLHVQPARGGVQVPFESPVNTPCCTVHG